MVDKGIVKKVSYYETDFGVVRIEGSPDLIANLYIKPDYHKERKRYLDWKKSSRMIEEGLTTLSEGIWREKHTLNSITVG